MAKQAGPKKPHGKKLPKKQPAASSTLATLDRQCAGHVARARQSKRYAVVTLYVENGEVKCHFDRHDFPFTDLRIGRDLVRKQFESAIRKGPDDVD